MRRTRVVAATALVAVSAMVLGACGSSPGQQTSQSSAAGSSAATASSASGGSSAASSAPSSGSSQSSAAQSGSSGSSSAASSAAAVGKVGGSACGTPMKDYPQPSGAPSGQVTYGTNELATSFNNATGHGNSTYNAQPLYLMSGPQLFYYNDKNQLINNALFGSCTLVSQDPLTIKYTINDGVKWSDGTPVTAADLFLEWAAESGWYNTTEAQYDQNGKLLPSKGIAFDSSSPGLALTKMPTISDNGQSLTLTYTSYFTDYDVDLGIGVPAHVVAMHALGIKDASKATAAMMKILQENTTSGKPAKDTAQLKKIADFWNTGFDTTQMPTDKSLYVSDGPYQLTEWQTNQFMAFTVNPNYNWGPKPNVKKILIQYAPDPTGAVQSLQNHDLQIINPQATPDVLTTLKNSADQGIKTISSGAATYEHVDLVFDNGGPFDPKTYGGGSEGAKKALDVRLAFLHTVPRQQIVDRLIKPLNPNTKVRDSFMLFPGQPGYDEMIKVNGSSNWDNAGSDAAITKAKQLLSQAGVKTPVKVRLMYAANNPRRAQEYGLIASSAKKAGFDVIDGKNANWASLLPNTKGYDASLFAWASTSTGVAQNPPQYLCKTGSVKEWGQNNFGHFCNAEVNKLMLDLQSQKDPKKQMTDMQEAEKILWANGFGTLLYQYPNVVGYDSTKVTGVSYAFLVPGVLWNFWMWKVPSGS